MVMDELVALCLDPLVDQAPIMYTHFTSLYLGPA